MRVMYRSAALVSLLTMAGCGGELPGDEPTGSVIAQLTTVPSGVLCIRVTMRGTTMSFGTSAGMSSLSLDLGVQASGSVQVSASAYDVTCASVTATTGASWVSDPINVAIAAGYTTNIALTLRPVTRTTASVDFFLPAVAIAAGHDSTYAVMQDGTVRAWGSNTWGQLGDGTTTARSTPVRVLWLPPGASQVAAGMAHACALTSGGVYCWGANFQGQLGDGTNTTRTTSAPIDASGVTMLFTSIVAGPEHTCGASSGDGAIYCWGSNVWGALGDDTVTDRTRPVPVAYRPLYAPTAGWRGTCALSDAGQVECWGFNYQSRFGVDVPESEVHPRPFALPWTASGVAIGPSQMCMMEARGTVRCLGDNRFGQLGDGTTTAHSAPMSVYGLSDATAVVAGDNHFCALRQDRTVACWGVGRYTGSGTSENALTPTPVLGLRDVTAITAGGAHTCALLADGSVRCWGANSSGQLGDGSTRSQFVPVRVRL